MNTISYTINWNASKYMYDVSTYITFSGIPSGQTVSVTGKLTYSGYFEDREGSTYVSRPFTINVKCSNGQTFLAGSESVGNTWVYASANLTLSFGSRSKAVQVDSLGVTGKKTYHIR